MKWPISLEKGPIRWKCDHWASFLGTRNRLSNARGNPFPGGYGLSLSVVISLLRPLRYFEQK